MMEIVRSAPGRRFQERYRRMRESKGGVWWRCLTLCGGVLLTLAGIFFLAVPGPGIPILAIGLALLAQESAGLARFLDRSELRARKWWRDFRASRKARGSRTR